MKFPKIPKYVIALFMVGIILPLQGCLVDERVSPDASLEVENVSSVQYQLDTCRETRTDGVYVYSYSIPPGGSIDIDYWIRYRMGRFPSYVAVIQQSSLTSSKAVQKKNGSGYLYCANESEKDDTLFLDQTKTAVVASVIANTYELPQFEQIGSTLKLEQLCIPSSKDFKATYLGADKTPKKIVTFNERTDYCLKSDRTYLVFAAPWSMDFDPETGIVPKENYKSMTLSPDLVFEHMSGSIEEGSYKWIQTGEVFTVDQIRQKIADALGVPKSSLRPSPVTDQSATTTSSSMPSATSVPPPSTTLSPTSTLPPSTSPDPSPSTTLPPSSTSTLPPSTTSTVDSTTTTASSRSE